MPKVTLRPTILADLPHVIGEPLPYRIRAITALIDDRVIGMGGIAFPSYSHFVAVLFRSSMCDLSLYRSIFQPLSPFLPVLVCSSLIVLIPRLVVG